MSNSDPQDRKEEYSAPQLLRPTFSSWIVVVAMAMQGVLCGLTWAFVGLMVIKILPLPDGAASWTQRKPSDANMLITVTSTVLGMIGSSLLGITLQHALTFRLSRGVYLSNLTAWVQLTKHALFLQPRRYLWFTVLSLCWVVVIGFLTTAWSNLLTPVLLVQQYPGTGQDLDYLNPILANYVFNNLPFPYVSPTTRNFSLTPESLAFLASDTGYLTQAGISAALVSLSPGYPAFIAQYNSSSGGVNPASSPSFELSGLPTLQGNYQGISTSYTLVQQGYTANVSCTGASSPSISLNNSASVERTFQSPLSAFNYSLGTWSWSTNCSGNAEYYTGEVDIMTSGSPASQSLIGNGLYATSICFYQNFSGPSNESFLVVMQSPSNSGYNTTYFAANPSQPIVCQFTPMVTTVELQFNQSGLANVNVLNQTLLPYDSWPLASIQAFIIWGQYFLAQGPYTNSFADALLDTIQIAGYNGNVIPVLEQYLRGVFEYYGSVIRAVVTLGLSPTGKDLPDNMTIPISGTMNVETVGWKFHPRTHCIALVIITLVTIATAISGFVALWEANYLKTLQDTFHSGSTRAFDPTNMTDILVATSMGSLGKALSRQRTEEEREKLLVELGVTPEGQFVLNARGHNNDAEGEGSV